MESCRGRVRGTARGPVASCSRCDDCRALGLTNVLMLLSPIPVIRARRPKSVTLASLAMMIATCVNALALSDRRRHHLGVGYYLWLSAFGLLALALLRRRQEQSLKI